MGLASTLLLWLALDLGFLPDSISAQLDQRQEYCQVIALNAAQVIEKQEVVMLEHLLSLVVEQNPEIQSLAFVDLDGNYVEETQDHGNQWAASPDPRGHPIYSRHCSQSEALGKSRVVYQPAGSSWVGGAVKYPVPLLLFFAAPRRSCRGF